MPSNRQRAAGGAAAAAAIAAGLALALPSLKTDEGKRNVGYLDIARIPTDCYGHTGKDVIVGRYNTDAQCDAKLLGDAQKAAIQITDCVPGLIEQPAHRMAASIRISFNIGGTGAFCKSTMARRFNAGDWTGGCDAFLAWNKARVKGQLVVVRGLTLRRQRERAMCLGDNRP